MKISAILTPEGIKREIDFQWATLPDGRSIQQILNENEILKKDIINLEFEVKQKSSILSKFFPWKLIRDIIEIILIISGIIGIIQIIL
jgi:hypothetical protein